MKALGTAERSGLPRFVSEQIYYSLQGRDAEYELIPAAVDQGLGVLVWSPLAGGLLSGKYRRGREAPAGSRQLTDWDEPPAVFVDGLGYVDLAIGFRKSDRADAVTGTGTVVLPLRGGRPVPYPFKPYSPV